MSDTTAPAVDEFTELMQDPAAREAFVTLKQERSGAAALRRYTHVLRAVGETPWAITQPMLQVIMDVLRMRAAGMEFSEAELQGRLAAARRREPRAGEQGVAVIPLTGVIVPKADMFSEVSGGTSLDKFRAMWRDAQSMDAVRAIVLDVDSPGGMVAGVPEMAAEMRAMRGRKPVVAVANTEMASGAYWLASQADQIVIGPSSQVGSIGVFTAHQDESVRNEQQGVRTTLVSAGKFKTEGNPFGPLDQGAAAHMQSIVDEYYGLFTRDVAKGRGIATQEVREGYGEGRVVTGSQALKLGMADARGSVEGVVHALLDAVPASSAPAASTSIGSGSVTSILTQDPGTVGAGWRDLEAPTDDETEGVARQDGPAEVQAAPASSGAPSGADEIEDLRLRQKLAELKARRT